MSSFELIPLFSGSSGNSTLVRAGDKNILFDIGRSCKQLKIALAEVGTNPSDIDAVFITHSHSDHICGVDVFVRSFPTKLFATRATLNSIIRKCTKCHPETPDIEVIPGDTIKLDEDLFVTSCKTPHDAIGSVCYKVTYQDKSLMIMTDLGFVSDDIRDMATGVDGILIESNYDRHMLVYGFYPEDLKARIAGPNGHLSNDDCAQMIKNLIDNGTRHFILGHLSENNNTPERAYETNVSYLKSCGLNEDEHYHIRVAERYIPTRGLVL